MPITPLHFGPSAIVSLPLSRYLDVPIFILASVIIDLEPLIVMVFDLNYPLHGIMHTYLIGGMIGLLWGLIGFYTFGILNWGMRILKLSYSKNFRRTLLSGLLGAWFHILLDSFLYQDIKPFFPLDIKPLYQMIDPSLIYSACLISFIPAIIIYVIKVFKK